MSKITSRRAGPATKRDDSAHAFLVVGIGASAGGFEALRQLLSQLPADTGMGFVYVQHLDPHHESMLSALLARTTAMTVLEARDGMAVAPNHVYIIPPNTNLGLLRGKLTLMPRPEESRPHMSIDYFFRSLADDRRDRAIGVVLSGTASDGTLGLQAIKAEGGLTFVQDPESAKYDGMPRSAISGNAADFVLSPEGIAKELTRVGRHPHLAFSSADAREVAIDDHDENLNKIFLLLRMATGVDFTHYKLPTLKRRIARRMVLSKTDNMTEYMRYLKGNPTETSALYQDLLINVTSFFRDPHALEVLKEKVFPKLIDEHGVAPLRVWVPGCSSGEEVYSLAIGLIECAQDAAKNVSIQIFATDISDTALEKARAGVYSENALDGISQERLRRFFVKVQNGYEVKKTVRDICLFARQDLSKDPPFSKLDMISCRNVLIYLNAAMQKKIIPMFHYALKPTGVLVLGNSETVGGFADLFRLTDKKNKIYMKKPSGSRPPLDFNSSPHIPGYQALAQRAVTPGGAEPDAKKEADRIVLKKYAPATVLINDNLDVLQFRGRTGDYLEAHSGTASLNLLKMTRDELTLDLRNALQRARKQNAAVQRDGIRVTSHGQRRVVSLEVTPFKPAGTKEQYFLVTFQSTPSRTGKTSSKGRAKRETESSRVAQLQQELATANEYLQNTIDAQDSTNEELRSALEEIQSSNEEMQSVNEELETAKEELQSTNEELTTVNEELQNRNAELDQTNNDLLNILSSVSIPVIMLSEDLRIRRFTPMAEKTMNLIPSDIGRPLADLRLNFVIPDLEATIREVMQTLMAKEFELQDRDGKWYSARIRPYQTADHKIDGVVMALVDIDSIKNRLLRNTQDTREYAEALTETIREPLLILDGSACIRGANRAYYRTFKATPETIENLNLYDVGGWGGNQRLRELLEELLPRNTRIEGFALEADFPEIGQRRLLLNASRIEREGGRTELILLAIEDVTTRSTPTRSTPS